MRETAETKRKIRPYAVVSFWSRGIKTPLSVRLWTRQVWQGKLFESVSYQGQNLLELTETMFGGQFGVAKEVLQTAAAAGLRYAVETAIQLTLTELNLNHGNLH